jgi:hypothetical protein
MHLAYSLRSHQHGSLQSTIGDHDVDNESCHFIALSPNLQLAYTGSFHNLYPLNNSDGQESTGEGPTNGLEEKINNMSNIAEFLFGDYPHRATMLASWRHHLP